MKMYQVFYLQGGWANMVCSSLNPLYSEDEAEKQIESLNKAGFPAMKIEKGRRPALGYFVSSFECKDEEEMKKYYRLAIENYFPYGNPLK